MNHLKSAFSPRRIALDGVLVALFFVLSLLSVEIAGVKITFSAVATMVGALLFGPVDGLLVGLLGAFAEQLIKYGITATTVLWILPPAIRGVMLGLCVSHMRTDLLQGKKMGLWMLLCVLSGLLVSVGNTMAFYADAKLFHYYSYPLIFGVFWVRAITGSVASALMGVVTAPLTGTLAGAGFAMNERKKK